MVTINKSVGRGVKNPNREEVELVQKLLNRHRGLTLPKISEDGKVGDETIAAIEEFQRRVVKISRPDGRVDPGGKTLELLSQPAASTSVIPSALAYWISVFASPAGDVIPKTFVLPPAAVGNTDTFSHPDASKVMLIYNKKALKMNAKAEHLLRSILASIGMTEATITSTLRTYQDQARITITQTYKADPAKVFKWYGKAVLDACKKYAEADDIKGFADWWKEYDTKRGKVSSNHLSNRALDVEPKGDRAKFADKVKNLIKVRALGVQRIIPKGTMGEPVDHVEFTFSVTDQAS